MKFVSLLSKEDEAGNESTTIEKQHLEVQHCLLVKVEQRERFPRMNEHISPFVEHATQITGQSAQRTEGLRDLVLGSTGELLNRYEFGEQPHRHSDSSHSQHVASIIEASQEHYQFHPSTINRNNTNHSKEGLEAEAMANQLWLQHAVGSDVATTNHWGNNSPGGNQPKRAEEMNRERPLGSDTDNSYPRHRHPDTQPQHLPPTSNIPLATFPLHTPPTHTATAAEIALGLSSPFHSRPDNRAQPAMAHDSRSQSRMRSQETSDKSTDISSVIESLSEVKDRDEENTSRTSETGMVTSPGRLTPLNDSSEHEPSDNPRPGGVGIGTPSTVSTAPSTDDASLGTDYRLDDSHLPNLLQGIPGHTRSNSWGEEGLLPGSTTNPYMPQLQEGPWLQGPSSPFASRPHWEPEHQQQHRIASFRDTVAPRNLEHAWHAHHPSQYPSQYAQAHQQPRWYPQEQSTPYASPQMQPETRQPSSNPAQSYGGYPQPLRKATGPQQQGNVPPAGTPPRPSRTPRQPGPVGHRQAPQGGHGSSPHQTGSSSQRSSSEILKTLLRKKACLYEPDTSRSVALVTWLVGRELALEFGFFSRQQLQSGVHACVSEKIESGTITRTKVNRCMQIILNSCFHYIIPRSDGSEEKGDVFRYAFAQTVQDDSFLLHHLPAPWNNLEVNRESILLASMADEEEKHHPPQKSSSTPKSSPRLSSVNAPQSPGREMKDGDDGDSKRAVLLSFNENVRSAEGVFRCHNEFIRDTAHAAHLQLTAPEWRSFFGREAARAPYLWGNIGIPIPSSEAKGGASRPQDALGQMSEDESAKFRTSWCSKRYDHDHDLCGFAHVEVCGGWLRRNPDVHPYEDQMCPYVSSAGDNRVGPSYFFVNECPLGVRCDKAHSMEEILYHPRRYKSKNCTAVLSRSGWCQLGDVCPNVHPPEATRPSKKSGDNRSHGGRHPKKADQGGASGTKPGSLPSSPMIYASPAPFSSFEHHLGMPGLQCLFRRHCSVVRAHVRTPGACKCIYSCFGDDLGINDRPPVAAKSRLGLPPSPSS